MSSYRQLLEQLENLKRQMGQAREKEKRDVIDYIRAKVAEYGLTEKDIFGAKSARGKTTRVAPKYRDPRTGAEWSGRGRAPAWIKGVTHRKDFLIVDAPTGAAAKKAASRRFKVSADSGMAGDARQQPKRKPTVPDIKND